jgi:hypothetical protein
MSLTLLLDKSILQGLSGREADALGNHYLLNMPPVLLYEIIGDLAKAGDADRPKWMAQKFTSSSAKVNLPWESLLEGSLLGQSIPMTGQILIPLDLELPDPDGGVIQFSDEQAAEVALRRWRDGRFSEAERIAAVHWRQQAKSIHPDSVLNALAGLPLVQPATFAELQAQVHGITSHSSCQAQQLNILSDTLDLPPYLRRAAAQRWEAGNYRSFARFAPYASHCVRTILAMGLGIASSLISSSHRKKNRVDLEYLFYLPFAHVFSTSDREQGELAQILMRDRQAFVEGAALKADLRRIVDFHESLSPEKRRAHRLEYGEYPPELPESVTSMLWARYMRPRPAQAGRSIQLEGEDLERAKAELMQKIELIKRERMRREEGG